jgi:hypothetical protein
MRLRLDGFRAVLLMLLYTSARFNALVKSGEGRVTPVARDRAYEVQFIFPAGK